VHHILDNIAYLSFFQSITAINVISISHNINIMPLDERCYKKYIYSSRFFYLKILDSFGPKVYEIIEITI
jgi:hypothetical protein